MTMHETETTTTDDRVREILRRVNVTEPGGDWSVFDVAGQLDPEARKPSHMFDTGPETWPRDKYVTAARESIARVRPSGRYVGGTSGYLYSIVEAQHDQVDLIFTVGISR